MKNGFIIAMVCAVCLGGISAAEAKDAAKKQGGDSPFLVLPDTTSPDGRYAVAWGLPGKPEVLQRAGKYVREGGEEGSLADLGVDEAENYVVDLRAKKVIAKLDSFYSQLPATARDSFETLWSPASDFVIVNHRHRSVSIALSVVKIESGKVLNLKAVLSPAVMKFFRSALKKARVPADHVSLAYSDLQHLGATRFSARVNASADDENNWEGMGALVQFTIEPSAAGLSAKVANVRAQ